MLRPAHFLLSPRHAKSRLLDRLPLCRRRYVDAGTLASISVFSNWHLSSDLVPISQKRFFGLHSASLPPTMNSSNEDSPRNKLMEDLLYVSDLDFREETPCSEPCAGNEPSQHLVEALAGISEDEDAAFVPFESDEATGGLQKRVLPEELAKAVMHLECESSVEGGHCDVYLVGTAHVSQDSCTEVQAVIRYLKPQAVFLELCSSRITILTPQNLKVPTVHEMIDMWKKKKMNTFGILYSWFLAKVAEKLEVFPGAEFRVAFEEATSYGARVILGDRPVNVTLRRTWGKMSLWHRAKFLYYILFQAFFLPSPEDLNKMLKDMDDVDMLTLVIQEMSKAFPTIMETVLHERDMYMSSTLLKVASEHSSIVAVVGQGHLPGIKKNWKQPVDLKQLMQAPSRRRASMSRTKLLTTISVGVAGVALASGIYLFVKR